MQLGYLIKQKTIQQKTLIEP